MLEKDRVGAPKEKGASSLVEKNVVMATARALSIAVCFSLCMGRVPFLLRRLGCSPSLLSQNLGRVFAVGWLPCEFTRGSLGMGFAELGRVRGAIFFLVCRFPILKRQWHGFTTSKRFGIVFGFGWMRWRRCLFFHVGPLKLQLCLVGRIMSRRHL